MCELRLYQINFVKRINWSNFRALFVFSLVYKTLSSPFVGSSGSQGIDSTKERALLNKVG